MDGLEHDEDRDEDEEHAVGEARQRLDASVAVCVLLVGLPGGHDGREETDSEGEAVEEHVDCYVRACER